MTTAQYIAAAAAVLLAAGPWITSGLERAAGWWFSDDHDHPPARLVGPSFKDAINALAGIRQRLIATDTFGAEQKTAIDALTLALVDGSDK